MSVKCKKCGTIWVLQQKKCPSCGAGANGQHPRTGFAFGVQPVPEEPKEIPDVSAPDGEPV